MGEKVERERFNNAKEDDQDRFNAKVFRFTAGLKKFLANHELVVLFNEDTGVLFTGQLKAVSRSQYLMLMNN